MSDNILRNYVSEIDHCLQNFDKKNPKLSLSQQKEIEKYRRIYLLRDNEISSTPLKDMWKDF